MSSATRARGAQLFAAMEQRHLAIAEPDIVEHGEGRGEAQLLRHQRDAEFLRVLRTGNRDRLAVDAHRAFIGRIESGDDLDQRALAGAVLAADGAHLASLEREADVLEDRVRPEPLGDTGYGENGHQALVRAACGELIDVVFGDAVDRNDLVFLQRLAVEIGGDLLGRELGFLGRDLRRRAVLLARPDVDDAVLHAVAGDHDDALLGDAER